MISPPRVELYYGHQNRFHIQEKIIFQLFRVLRIDMITAGAIALLEYKMKFEPIRYREKTTECFGKKVTSWHGAAIFYHGSLRSPGYDESVTDTFDIQKMFLDHVVRNNMKQDFSAVCCLLDVVLARLAVERLSVRHVYLLSDNATGYQNDMLPSMAPSIAKEHWLMLKAFVHSETQRGKSLLDAHFTGA